MKHFRRFTRPAVRGLTLAGLLVAAGCGGSGQRAATRPAVTPAITSVSDLMSQLDIDDRVFMEHAAAPATTEQRQAVLKFFDAFVRGRHALVRPMLAEGDRRFLDQMVASDTFVAMTESIEEVQLLAGRSPDGRQAVLGMYVRDGVEEYQLWYYDLDGGRANFEAAATPAGIAARLRGPIDGYIDLWHEILEKEMRGASQPDEDRVLDAPRRPSTSEGPIRRMTPALRRPPPGIPG